MKCKVEYLGHRVGEDSAVECAGRLESVIVEALIKRSFTSILCIYFLFSVLNILGINFIFVVYMVHKHI